MLTRLFLLRHGEVDAAWQGRVYGCLDVPLSEKGERQAARAAERLSDVSLDAVVSSGLDRARRGARLVAARCGCEEHVDTELREIDRGDWTGQTIQDLDAQDPPAWSEWLRAPTERRPPGGESLGEVAARILPRLDQWAVRHPGGGVACVAHRWVIRAAMCAALRLPLDRSTRLDIPTGEMVVLDWPVPPAGGGASRPRPTLVGFGIDQVPAGRVWFRSPGRDVPRG